MKQLGQVQSIRLNVQCVPHVTTLAPPHLRRRLSRRRLLHRLLPLIIVLLHPLLLVPGEITTTLHRHHRLPPPAAAAAVITTIHHLHLTKITLLDLLLHLRIQLFRIFHSTFTILHRLHSLLLLSSLIFHPNLLFSLRCSLRCWFSIEINGGKLNKVSGIAQIYKWEQRYWRKIGKLSCFSHLL